jgi:hypothetical protein
VTNAPYTFAHGAGNKYILSDLVQLTSDVQTKATLQSSLLRENNKSQLLTDAIDHVSSQAIARGLNASAAPNVATIASTLRTSLQSPQMVETNTDALLSPYFLSPLAYMLE